MMPTNQNTGEGHQQCPQIPEVSLQSERRCVTEVGSKSHTARGMPRGEGIMVYGGDAEEDGPSVGTRSRSSEEELDGSYDHNIHH